MKMKESQAIYPTGYEALNKLIGGWKPGELVVVLGAPSIGLEIFMVNLFKKAYLNTSISVKIASLNRCTIFNKMVQCFANVPHFDNPFAEYLSKEEMELIKNAYITLGSPHNYFLHSFSQGAKETRESHVLTLVDYTHQHGAIFKDMTDWKEYANRNKTCVVVFAEPYKFNSLHFIKDKSSKRLLTLFNKFYTHADQALIFHRDLYFGISDDFDAKGDIIKLIKLNSEHKQCSAEELVYRWRTCQVEDPS